MRRGQGLSNKLKELNLSTSSSQHEDERSIIDETAVATTSASARNPTRSSSTKSSKLGGKSPKPYEVPSAASGPGGLLTMLKSLRKMRDENENGRISGATSSQISQNTTAMETEEAAAVVAGANSTVLSDGDTLVTHNESHNDVNNNEEVDPNNNLESHPDSMVPTELERKIIRQVEYYFGDYNLPKDKWMLEKMEECDEGWFDMETMMTFKRLSSLTQDPSVVLMALAKSPNDLLQIENWGRGMGRVRRNPRRPIPRLSEARRISIQATIARLLCRKGHSFPRLVVAEQHNDILHLERTLFVWGFDKTSTSLDDLIEYFENNFRNVVNIRQRTAPVKEEEEEQEGPEKEPKREFMGSVFVTFATCRDAEDFYRDRHHRLIFRDRKLKAKWQREFFRERAEFNDDFDKETIETTIYVSGFDKIDTSQDELRRFFSRFSGTTAMRKRVFRFACSDGEWQFTGGVFVTFDTKDNAEEFIAIFGDTLTYNGDTLRVKWLADFFKSIKKPI